MNILLVNTADNYGGAALASVSLCEALNSVDHNAKLLVRDNELTRKNIMGLKRTNFQSVKDNWAHKLEYARYLYMDSAKHAAPLFSAARYGRSIANHELFKWADVIHLNWINNSFLRMKDLEEIFNLGKPVVWHLHDLWPLMGACHHPLSCTRFEEECGTCPLLKRSSADDRSSVLFKAKKKLYSEHKPVFVLPSKWMLEMAKKSSLNEGCKLVEISNPIDQRHFRPISKLDSKRELGLSKNKKYLLAGAANSKLSFKGMEALKAALQYFCKKEDMNNVELLVFGKADMSWSENLGLPVNFMGYIQKERLPLVYSAADVFLFPSEVESFGLTLVESLSCGTPAVSFGAGISPEIIEHKKNSYLVEAGNVQGFADGIEFILQNARLIEPDKLHKEIAARFSYEVIAKQYSGLLNSLA